MPTVDLVISIGNLTPILWGILSTNITLRIAYITIAIKVIHLKDKKPPKKNPSELTSLNLLAK